jgi:hypothetical protein
MSRTPGNPPAPVNSAVYIVGVYNDPAILDWPVRAYGHHAPAWGICPSTTWIGLPDIKLLSNLLVRVSITRPLRNILCCSRSRL